MADVWISRPRWTCPYCDVTINDDRPSRQHHENGMRHKNNVERALRGLYKENSVKRREEDQAQRELAKIERVGARADPGGAGEPPCAGWTERATCTYAYTAAAQASCMDARRPDGDVYDRRVTGGE